MLLNISDARFKLIAVIVAVALIAPMVLMPAGAASAGESNDKSNTITLLVEPSKEMIEVINSKGAEIEIIEEENMPVIVGAILLQYW
ncbi:hypothetical protein M1N06_04865 [Peptococcaceae bacterium]|nr:hypothetical protein [Peptococcaceae bacterium]